jgi:hypothetical protein
MKSETVVKELKKLARQNGGVLQAETVVEAAQPEESPLHPCFEWDNSQAGHLYRLHQARQLIRVSVVYEPQTDTHVRAFISLTPDREVSGGGYREMIAVLSRKDMKEQMLADALAELESFQAKYAALKELAEVFKAIKKVQKGKS